MTLYKSYSDAGIVLTSGTSRVQTQTLCPQCSHTRKDSRAKCLSVNTDKKVWQCHHCGWTGGLQSDSFQSLPNGSQASKSSWTIPNYTFDEGTQSEAIEWLQTRGISDSLVKRHQITSGKVWMPQTQQEEPVVMFPYFRSAQTVNVKYRTLQNKHFKLVTGAERILYGLDDIQPDLLVIVEGEIDKLSIEMAGISSCVSVPNGAPAVTANNLDNHLSPIESAQDFLAPVKKIVLAIDGDEPGRRLQTELAQRLGEERCFVVDWPDGCKDANDVLVRMGPECLRTLIEEACPYPIEGIVTPKQLQKSLLALAKGDLNPGVTTGFTSLDEYYRPRLGEWTLMTGIPGHGKSEILDQLMINLIQIHGWRFGVFSPENAPLERHLAKLIEKFTERPIREGLFNRLKQEEIQAAIAQLNQSVHFVEPKDWGYKIDDLLDLGGHLVRRYGINGLIIDPWNEIDHHRPSNLTETEYISHCLSKIRQWARSNQVHVWLVAHPAKMLKFNGKYPVPTPYDVSGSAHWRNKADNCLAVYRDVTNAVAGIQVHVQKIRFRENGKPGVVELLYNKRNGCFTESTLEESDN